MSALPAPAEWNTALEHSLANPTHILGPYTAADGTQHIDCIGTDPYEPNCDFTTEKDDRDG